MPLLVARETVHLLARASLRKGNMCLWLLLGKLYSLLLELLNERAICALIVARDTVHLSARASLCNVNMCLWLLLG